MRENEQLFRSIFENAQIGIGVFKIDEQKLSPNRALQEMLGYSEKELGRLETWDRLLLLMRAPRTQNDMANSSKGNVKRTNGNNA